MITINCIEDLRSIQCPEYKDFYFLIEKHLMFLYNQLNNGESLEDFTLKDGVDGNGGIVIVMTKEELDEIKYCVNKFFADRICWLNDVKLNSITNIINIGFVDENICKSYFIIPMKLYDKRLEE